MDKEVTSILKGAPAKNERSDDFASTYGNNVLLEASTWDLKLIFGELDNSTNTIQQHTAVTIPWMLAKLLSFHLALQLKSYELIYGQIAIPDDVFPPEIPPPPEQLAKIEMVNKVYEMMKEEREKFIASFCAPKDK